MQRDLVVRAQRGDLDAFSALTAGTSDRLFGAARLILRDDERAADAVQDALLQAWLDVRGLRDPVRFDAWPAAVDPRQLWIAYGVVVDTDGDGVPDWRYGVDNVLPDKTDTFAHTRRWWRTDLHTGRTESAVGDDHIHLGDSGVVFWSGSGGLQFGVENVGIGEVGGMPKRFYVWASVIQDGRVVATDYAPDDGWLAPSADAKP